MSVYKFFAQIPARGMWACCSKPASLETPQNTLLRKQYVIASSVNHFVSPSFPVYLDNNHIYVPNLRCLYLSQPSGFDRAATKLIPVSSANNVLFHTKWKIFIGIFMIKGREKYIDGILLLLEYFWNFQFICKKK